MSTRELERDLRAVLNRHAEDAMDRTDTLAERARFYDVIDAKPHNDRRRWVVAVAAAAAAVTAVAVLSNLPGDDPASPPPANPPDSAEMSDLGAAEGLAAAFGALEADGAAPYLAPGVEEPWPDWSVHMRSDAAWNVENLMEPCVETNTNAVATTFSCPYSVHMLGSDELGKAPFPDHTLNVFVKEGRVLAAEVQSSWETNGVKEHMDSVFRWLDDNHPKQVYFLTEGGEAEFTPAEWARYTQLWQQYIQEYVEATNAE